MNNRCLNSRFTLLIILLAGFFLSSCLDSTGSNEEEEEPFNHQRNPGVSAEELLRAGDYTDLALEIDYMPGHQPDQEALDSLKLFLEQRLQKTNVTIRTPTEIPSGGKQAYTAEDVRSLEQQHRNHRTGARSTTLETYFVIVDAEFDEANVLGIAYYNTSMAFFGSTIESASSGIGAPSRRKIEGTVFRHEFGHIMGLVDSGTPAQSSHATDDGHHCNTDGCLMEPAVETSDYFSNIFDGDIPNLGDLCIEDLRANGGR